MTKDSQVLTNLKKKINAIQLNIKETIKTPTKQRILKDKIANFFMIILKYVLLYGLCFIILYPIIQQVAVALRLPEDVNNPTVLWIPETFSLLNFRAAMAALNYWQSLRNTVVIAFGVTVLQVVVTSIMGYALARLRFKGRNLIFSLVIFTLIVPYAMISLPAYINFNKWGMVGKPITLFLMTGFGMGIKSGVFIYLFRQFFRGIPEELEESAQIDGANVFQVFLRVMLPNARGAIVTVALLAFVWQWNDNYFSALFISENNPNMSTLATQLQYLIWSIDQALRNAGYYAFIGQDISKNPFFFSMIQNAGGILTMLPLLVLYFFVQRLFVEGVERTGIVG